MLIDCATYNPTQLYFILTQTIIPRPIAWVLSDNGNATYNLAPFSFFNAIDSEPPLVVVSIGWKNEATRKDTWVNIRERKYFVIHIPSSQDVQEVSSSSSTLPHGVSETEQFHIALEKIEGWELPKVKQAKVAFLCQPHSLQEIGHNQQGLVIGQIHKIWLAEDIVHEEKNRLVIDPKKFNPLGRLGGSHYAGLGDVLSVPRPK